MTNALISYSQNNDAEIKHGILNLQDKTIIRVDSLFSLKQINEKPVHLEEVRIASPIHPSKIVCVGLNYKDHAQEFNFPIPEEPLLFAKMPTSIIPAEATIILPEVSKRVDYEAELVIVIKETTKNISEKEALKAILGYTCGNDVTARDLQKKDGQWTRAKSFDTFAPIGPWVIPAKEIDPKNLNIFAKKNGEVLQYSNTCQMIFNPLFLVSYISQIMTLHPGDLIMTGTPSGVGKLEPGDIIEIEIENIGTLKNYVEKSN